MFYMYWSLFLRLMMINKNFRYDLPQDHVNYTGVVAELH